MTLNPVANRLQPGMEVTTTVGDRVVILRSRNFEDGRYYETTLEAGTWIPERELFSAYSEAMAA